MSKWNFFCLWFHKRYKGRAHIVNVMLEQETKGEFLNSYSL